MRQKRASETAKKKHSRFKQSLYELICCLRMVWNDLISWLHKKKNTYDADLFVYAVEKKNVA